MFKKKSCLFIIFCIAVFAAAFFSLLNFQEKELNAANKNISPNFVSYEMTDNSNFDYSTSAPVTNFVFGDDNVGDFRIYGDINSETTFRNTQAYGINKQNTNSVQFTYSYTNARLQKNNIDDWALSDCELKNIVDTSLENPIGYGTILIQTSINGDIWENSAILNNVLSTTNTNVVYEVNDIELERGTYFKVILAYEVKHKTGTKGILWWKKDVFEYRQCVEVYDFFMCYDSSCVFVEDIFSGEKIPHNNSVEYGFKINKGNSSNLVSVLEPNGTKNNVSNGKTFLSSGTYTIVETTKLGKIYTTSIKVTKGMSKQEVNPSIYCCEDNLGYPATSENITIDKIPLSSFQVVVYDGTTHSLEDNNLQNIGVSTNQCFFFLGLNTQNLPSDWIVSNDTWGLVENQYVNNIFVGPVDSGALILQKSTDGSSWEFCQEGLYNDGVFTTDYFDNFGEGDNIIYTPLGSDIISGCYYKITYAYELYNLTTKKYQNIIETYTFYLCNDDVSAITFHNLSSDALIEDSLKDEDSTTIELYKKSETLVNNSETIDGFRIDYTLNPNVEINICKNGSPIEIPSNLEITDQGKYDIEIYTKFGTKRNITIYVNKLDFESLYNYYFIDNFISGKRIYSELDYPVFEGGYTTYQIISQNKNLPLLSGEINNITTGEKTIILPNENGNTGEFVTPGEYVVKLNTNQTYLTDFPAGDNHAFIFRFYIIEQGTAPGPIVNQNNLEKYTSNANTSNYYPIYYGVTYQSAASGYITLAFATEKAAKEFVYNYEKGMVEVQIDGTYRYNGSLIIKQKEIYESAWDLTDAINFFTEQAVQKLYFDLSDLYTYTTLTEEVISQTNNLRTLELNNSVVVFANENEKQQLIAQSNIPLINSKFYSYINPGLDEMLNYGKSHFEFIKDTNGYDSNIVSIFDENGKQYSINYFSSVEEQLVSQNCPSGILTIVENTIYGDESTYKVGFIRPGDNITEIIIQSGIGDVVQSNTFSMHQQSQNLECNYFSIQSIIDDIDPYNTLIISHNDQKEIYCTDNLPNKTWTENGIYNITLINRLGTSFSFNITVDGNYNSITINGMDGENSSSFLYVDNSTVTLPTLEKYGYNFIGYANENGVLIPNEITSILLKGYSFLDVIWEAKKFSLKLYNGEELLSEKVVEFGGTYTLPNLDSTETDTFVGWFDENGTKIETLEINEESDIQLFARFEKKNNQNNQDDENNSSDSNIPSQDEDNQEQNNFTKDGNYKLHWLIAIIFVIAIIIGCLLIADQRMDEGWIPYLVISIILSIILVALPFVWWLLLIIGLVLMIIIVFISCVID